MNFNFTQVKLNNSFENKSVILWNPSGGISAHQFYSWKGILYDKGFKGVTEDAKIFVPKTQVKLFIQKNRKLINDEISLNIIKLFEIDTSNFYLLV